MGKPDNLKQGEYYGYYDEKGNWITGQNGKNPLPSEWPEERLNTAIARLKHPFKWVHIKMTLKELFTMKSAH